MPQKSHVDHPSRFLAIAVFLAGVAILFCVFSWASHLFHAPVTGLGLSAKPGVATPPPANIGLALTGFFEQLLLLGMMTVLGSLIASKGIHLYFAASHWAAPQTYQEDMAAEKAVKSQTTGK